MKTKSLLLIDDDIEYASILSKHLYKHSFTVSIAHSLDEAITILNSNIFNYSIVDLNLKSSSGLKVIPLIKQNNPNAKIVMLTGYASINTSIDAIKLGATYYLSKPVDVIDIINSFDLIPNDINLGAEPLLDLKAKEMELIIESLKENDFNITKTAAKLGMHRRTLQRKLKKRFI